MVDFFQSRLEVDVPKRVIPTVTFTARQCPVCQKWARTLVRPPQSELQCEICVDFCEGDKKYPKSYVSFRGSWIKDGNAVIETLKGDPGPVGPQGPPGRDGMPPTREELTALIQEILDERQANGFWKRSWRKIFRPSVAGNGSA